MASSIDATKPTAGAALTADVRNNFSAAKTEIEALQAAVASALVAKAGDTMTGALNWAATQTIASAATTDIGAATSNSVIVSGTTTITALGTIAAGAERVVQFSGALTLTHNATSLILPGGASITTAAGDVAYFVSLGTGNWRCTGYQKANGQAVVASGGTGDFKADGTVAGTGNFTTTGSMRADGGFSVNGDTLLQRVSAANWRLGAADASAPVAQTLSVQNVIAGTSNTAGADRTYLGSASTGNAVGGGHVFKTTPAGSSGSAQNSQATAMTIAGSGNVGIGQTTPTAGLHIDTAARSVTGLKIRTAAGQDLFDYLKPDGASLLRAVWDGSTFYYYYSGSIYVGSGNIGIGNLSPGQKLDVAGNIKSSGFQRTTPVTVATLSAAATAGAGARHSVTDSTVAASGNFGAAVTGGGSNIVPVYSDGTSWRIG